MAQENDEAGGHAASLRESRMPADPLEQFRLWYEEAVEAGISEPGAMALATSTPNGAPSVRVVLLRSFDAAGFVFFTHYASRKGREIEANPRAALALHWSALDRQVRIEGRVERISPAESDAYFDSRPVGSRMSAIASPQSAVVADRRELERRVEEVIARHRHGSARLERPSDWGGYRVRPETVEFWLSRMHRLHDRIRYRRDGDHWQRERLAP